MLAVASLFLVPALGHADIYNPHAGVKLGRSRADMSLRKLIANKLNQMPANQVGRAGGKFLPTKFEATKYTHPGAFGTQISIKFQAQPRVRIKMDGKRRSVYLGGCAGNCGILRPVQGKDRMTNMDTTAKLRSMAPPMALR